MNELMNWTNEEFGVIRTIDVEGEPWFVAKDICDVLEYGNSRDAVRKHVWDKNKTTVAIRDTGSNYKHSQSIINESGVYQLIFASKMPKAEEFQAWVFDVVLPSIRRTGGYVTNDVATEIINGNVEVMNNIIAASMQLNQRLIAENQQLLEHNEELQETIDQYDELIGGKGYFYIGRLGKETGIGANKIRKLMAEDKIIYKTKRGWQSYARYDGWFHAKLSSGDWGTTITLMLTPKGYTELLKRYKTKTLVGFAEVQTAIEEENNF